MQKPYTIKTIICTRSKKKINSRFHTLKKKNNENGKRAENTYIYYNAIKEKT